MASKYIKKFKVPQNFETILNDFAKEVLRIQPKDIIDFGYEYFKAKEENRTLDYPYKGENRPEVYKRPEKEAEIIRGPNIIPMTEGQRNNLNNILEQRTHVDGNDEFSKGFSYDKLPPIDHKPIIETQLNTEVKVEEIKNEEIKTEKKDITENITEKITTQTCTEIKEHKINDRYETKFTTDMETDPLCLKSAEKNINEDEDKRTYERWFERNCERSGGAYSKAESVFDFEGAVTGLGRQFNPIALRTYEQWFYKHCEKKTGIEEQ